ncbi:hypothetical protein C8J57DRAFT_1250927 [Mycena rebaudengoi]|nr:hypothetical protein C8J57DRAFT_1250927 [Mycena rebaudengoi]
MTRLNTATIYFNLLQLRFPAFHYLPSEDYNRHYYSRTGHWCFLAEIKEAIPWLRLMYHVTDKTGFQSLVIIRWLRSYDLSTVRFTLRKQHWLEVTPVGYPDVNAIAEDFFVVKPGKAKVFSNKNPEDEELSGYNDSVREQQREVKWFNIRQERKAGKSSETIPDVHSLEAKNHIARKRKALEDAAAAESAKRQKVSGPSMDTNS